MTLCKPASLGVQAGEHVSFALFKNDKQISKVQNG